MASTTCERRSVAGRSVPAAVRGRPAHLGHGAYWCGRCWGGNLCSVIATRSIQPICGPGSCVRCRRATVFFSRASAQPRPCGPRDVPSDASTHYTYNIEAERPLYSIVLPATFDVYMQGFSTKSRYNVRRSVKLFRAAVDNQLELRRFDHPSDVPSFIDGVKSVLAYAWKRDMPEYFTAPAGADALTDVARRGLLRSYLLLAGGVPWRICEWLSVSRVLSLRRRRLQRTVCQALARHGPAVLADPGLVRASSSGAA